jgi:hypothetical protein
MRRTAVLVLAVVTMLGGSACPKVPDALVDPGAVDGLCWWRGAKWDGRGALRVRQTGEVLGYAHPSWSKPESAAPAWLGANASGVLRLREDHVVFEGQWSGGGLTLAAEANATEEAFFTLWLPHKLSKSSLAMRGAPVRLSDARLGRAMVLPSARSLEAFVPDEVPSGEVPCDALALRASQAPPPEPRALLARAGFPADATAVRVKVDRELGALPASDVPNGEFVGGFFPGAGSVFEVARQGEHARLVAVGDNTLWVGWVDAEFVEKVERPQAIEFNPARARKELDRPTWRACERELTVSVRTAHGLRKVGVLEANTRFAVTGGSDFEDGIDQVAIWPGVNWLEPGTSLLAPAWASSCPVVTGAW